MKDSTELVAVLGLASLGIFGAIIAVVLYIAVIGAMLGGMAAVAVWVFRLVTGA